MKKISVVIPAYNKVLFIEQAIQSVLTQSYKNFELIVVDDGSTDGTQEVIKKFESHLIYLRQHNQGQSVAINNGWKVASGDLIGYLSGDDFFHRELFSEIIYAFDTGDIVGAYPNVQIVDSSGVIIRNVNVPEFNYSKVMEDLICPPSVGLFIKKHVFIDFGGWDCEFKRIPDFEYLLRIGACGKFRKIQKTLGSFRVSDGSYSQQVLDIAGIEEPVRAVKKFINGNPKVSIFLAEKMRASAYLISGQFAARSGKFLLALRYWFLSISSNKLIILSSNFYKVIINGLFFKIYTKIVRI